jgi:biopolymer transport protein ExbD
MRNLRHLKRLFRHYEAPELNLISMMDIFTVLVFFLLLTTVFSPVTILQLDLPAAVGPGETSEKKLEVEVIVRKDRIELSDGEQIVMRIPNIPAKAPDSATTGEAAPPAPVPVAANEPGHELEYDLASLNKVLVEIKNNYPDKLDATVLMEPDLEYDVLVRIMDTVSSAKRAPDPVTRKAERYDLFPQISVGDAPATGT